MYAWLNVCFYGLYVAVNVMSSAKVMCYVCLGGVGMSEVYMLRSVSKRTTP